MKIRTGLVSNSSSSSFVVTSKTGNTKVRVFIEIELTDLNGSVVKDERDLLGALQNVCLEEHQDIRNVCLDALERGETLVIGSFDDDSLPGAMRGDDDFVTIVRQDTDKDVITCGRTG